MRKTLGAFGVASALAGCTTDNNTQLPPELIAPIPPVQESTVQILSSISPQQFTPQNFIAAPMTQEEIRERQKRMRPRTEIAPGRYISYPKGINDSELRNNNFVTACEFAMGKMEPIGEATIDNPLRCSSPGACHTPDTRGYPKNMGFMQDFETGLDPNSLIFHGARVELTETRGFKAKISPVKRMQTFINEDATTGKFSCTITTHGIGENSNNISLTLYEDQGLSREEIILRINNFIENAPISEIPGVMRGTGAVYSGGMGSLTEEQKVLHDKLQLEQAAKKMEVYLNQNR